MAYEFEAFPKIPRFKRELVVTEKIDGTNAQIAWAVLDTPESYLAAVEDPLCLRVYPAEHDGDSARALYAGSRNRWITPEKDNFDFAKWVYEHADELWLLGPGRHFGEWYGAGIQRAYGLTEKRFALFNTARWEEQVRPACCGVVPMLARGGDVDLDKVMWELNTFGSRAVPSFKNPEGIVIYHTASRQMYKRTFEQDDGKWRAAA